MYKMLTFAAVIGLVCLGSGLAEAQTRPTEEQVDAHIELMRKNLAHEKADIVAKTMELDADEAAAFWPLYKQCEAARKQVGDERLTIVKDYAKHYGDMTEEVAKDLLARAQANDVAGSKQLGACLAEMQKQLPASLVARYYQVEKRIRLLMELNMASEIPLMY